MIIWDAETMSTGVANIDSQHKELIAKFNALTEAIKDGHGREETGEILDFLQFYAAWHFKREEACMDEYKCPIAAKNKQAHQFFLTRFNHLYEQYQESDIDSNIMYETVKELEDWIVTHICKVDTMLRSCVT